MGFVTPAAGRTASAQAARAAHTALGLFFVALVGFAIRPGSGACWQIGGYVTVGVRAWRIIVIVWKRHRVGLTLKGPYRPRWLSSTAGRPVSVRLQSPWLSLRCCLL